jgi:hypothetical protein
MRILELGCGWGSISLWAAEHFPDSDVLAVSNSQCQREYLGSGMVRGIGPQAARGPHRTDEGVGDGRLAAWFGETANEPAGPGTTRSAKK